MLAIKAMQVTPDGPDTHNNPHQMGAARTAARPHFVQNFFLRNYQKSLNFLFV